LTSQRARKSQLRKIKTDAADAYHVGELYYKEEFEPYKQRGIQLLRSIPEVGDKIAATILSEIGELEQFDHPKK
jgi:transposase